MEDKKVLTLLLGSPRIGGNTEKLADALAEGAAENGYEVKKVHLATLTLKGCLDCRKCWSTGKPCIQNDDMDQVYPEIEDASVIAFVSPLYFYSWSSQIKPVWDRLLPYYMPGALRTTPSKKTILLGVSFALVDFASSFNINFPELIIMETGGMKGRGKEMSREEIHNIIKGAFGVEKVHSE